MAYRIVFTSNAIDDYNEFNAHWRAIIRDALKTHLTHEPAKVSKSRIKRLKELTHPEYRLRVDDVRVFYDIVDTDVVILGIISKEKMEQWLNEHGEK